MSEAVILTGVGGDQSMTPARIVQLHSLLEQLDLVVDLVWVTEDRGAAIPDLPGAGFRRMGCIPGEVLARDGSALGRFLLRMNGGLPYALGNMVAVDLPAERSAAPVWIAEPSAAPSAGDADFYLARTELDRRAFSALGQRALRLPFRPLGSGAIADGQAIGWIGDWSADRVAVWSEALALLSRHGTDLAGGIILMGPGAESVVVPDNLSQWTAVGRSCGHLSVLGLAAAPGPALPSDDGVLWRCLEIGRPILLGREAADAHEGRWQLPTIDTARGMCELVMDWTRDQARFSADLMATRDAFYRDLDAMTAHAIDQVAALMAMQQPA